MSVQIEREELKICIEAASRVTAAAVQSGNISEIGAKSVEEYFDIIFHHVLYLLKTTNPEQQNF